MNYKNKIKLRKGDEIIVPPLTFIATSFAPLFLGAVPVFADIDQINWCLDIQSLKRKISKVHLRELFPVIR